MIEALGPRYCGRFVAACIQEDAGYDHRNVDRASALAKDHACLRELKRRGFQVVFRRRDLQRSLRQTFRSMLNLRHASVQPHRRFPRLDTARGGPLALGPLRLKGTRRMNRPGGTGGFGNASRAIDSSWPVRQKRSPPPRPLLCELSKTLEGRCRLTSLLVRMV